MSERLTLADWTLIAAEGWGWGAPAVVFAIFAITHASNPAAAVTLGAVTVALTWLACRHLRRMVSGDWWQARRGLNRALKHMAPTTAYLARDDHVFLYRKNERVLGVPFIMLTRIPEDDAQDFLEDGHGIVTAETLKLSPVHLRVITQTGGNDLVTTEDGEARIVPEAPRSRRERARGNVTVLRMLRHGALYASPAELRALTAQILAAEPAPAA